MMKMAWPRCPVCEQSHGPNLTEVPNAVALQHTRRLWVAPLDDVTRWLSWRRQWLAAAAACGAERLEKGEA